MGTIVLRGISIMLFIVSPLWLILVATWWHIITPTTSWADSFRGIALLLSFNGLICATLVSVTHSLLLGTRMKERRFRSFIAALLLGAVAGGIVSLANPPERVGDHLALGALLGLLYGLGLSGIPLRKGPTGTASEFGREPKTG